MLNLDNYLNNTIEVQVFDEVIHVKEPSMAIVMAVNAIEADMDKTNIQQKQLELAKLFLDNNKESVSFTIERLQQIPYEGIMAINSRIAIMRYEADTDPNLESQSQPEK